MEAQEQVGQTGKTAVLAAAQGRAGSHQLAAALAYLGRATTAAWETKEAVLCARLAVVVAVGLHK
jgi:hypothetical protein